LLTKLKARNADRKIDTHLADAFNQGKLLACITSRPGQSGRLDGYILEGKELEFYLKKTERKKK
jgi:small subunit ribosomal protein S8e